MRVNLDSIARATVAIAVAATGAGIGWGFWENHNAASATAKILAEQHEVSRLLAQHSHDLKVQEEENRALSGAVLYVEESIAAICGSTYHVANCPKPPGAFP